MEVKGSEAQGFRREVRSEGSVEAKIGADEQEPDIVAGKPLIRGL